MQPFTKRRVSPKMRREMAFQAAWEELVHRYGPVVQGQVRRTLHDAGFPFEPEEVEERVQEVYCRLVMGGPRRLRRLRQWSRTQVVAYLARIAQGVVVDEVRSLAAAKRGGPRTSFGGCLREVAERTADPRGNPEQQAILAESRRLLLARCRLLAESMSRIKDRGLCLRILRLALLEGWSSQEISLFAGGCLAPSTVDSLVHRARRRLALVGVDVPSRRRRRRPLVSSCGP
jgi:DNA-directed RNA polymerase specialized sigma24 family protein